MKIEFEFYFKGDPGDENIKHEAWYAIRGFVNGNEALGNIDHVELIEMTDWDAGEEGIHCCAILEGSEKDLRYLVFKNGGMDMGPDGFLEYGECQEMWENCVEILTNEEVA